MTWRDIDADSTSSGASPAPVQGPGPYGAFPAFRNSGDNPYQSITYGGGTTTGRWKYVADATTPAWYVVPDDYNGYYNAGEAPPGYVWYSTSVGGGKSYFTLYNRSEAGGDPIGYDPGTNPEDKRTFGPLLSVPQDGRVVLTGPSVYQIRLDAHVDKWVGGGETLITIPEGGTLTLTNPLHSIVVSGPVAGVIKSTKDVTVTLTYRKLEGDTGGPYSPEGFNASMRQQWANRSQAVVDVQGDFGIDTSNPKAYFFTWPTITAPGSALGGALDTLGAIAAWLIKWGPWILLALGVILLFWLLPHIVLLIAKGIEAWKTAYAAIAAAV